MTNPTLAVDDIDLSDLAFWERPWEERNEAFRVLREQRPIAFFEEPELEFLPAGPGYWAITRHADVLEVSHQPELFCSGQGAVAIIDMPPELNEFYGSMISMDDPRHARIRRIVSAAFTPRMLQGILDQVERVAAELVDSIADRGEIDLVTDLAAPFPLQIICDMMGIPASERELVLTQANIILSGGDPELIPEGTDPIMAFLEAGTTLAALMDEVGEQRRKDPRDDLVTALVSTTTDEGEQFTQQELASFFILLSVAGHETTRNGISHGVWALSQNPDQKAIWAADVENVTATAVDEIVRYGSPVIFMRRTATQDVTLSGHEFHEGDKVILFYGSANRDAEVFEDPDRFDVLRNPNPHVGFGGPGPHFCLGAHLARREIAVLFRELFRRIPDFEASGPPQQLRSNFINGIRHLPMTFTPVGPRAS
jgi:cytochrome P450